METKHLVYLSAILLFSAGLDAMPFGILLLKTTSTSLPTTFSKSPTTFKPVQTTVKSPIYPTDKTSVSPDPVKIDLSETNKTSQGDHSSSSTTDKVSVPHNETDPVDLTTAEKNANHHHNKEGRQSSYPYFHPEFHDDVDDSLEIKGVVTKMKEKIVHAVLGLVNENKSEKNSVHLSLQVNFNYKPKYHAVSVDVSGNTLTGKVPIPVLGHAHKDIFESVFNQEKES